MSGRERYFRELDRSLRLRGRRRTDALAEIESHIEEAVAAGEDEAAVLARLGKPAEVARALNRVEGEVLTPFAALGAVLTLPAMYFAVAALNPLSRLFGYQDSPLGLYVTMTGIGLALAGVFATAAAIAVSSRFRRSRASWSLLADFAFLASVLPYVLLQWTSETVVVAWGFLVTDWIAWLLLPPSAPVVGYAVQVALALLFVGAVIARARTDPEAPEPVRARRHDPRPRLDR